MYNKIFTKILDSSVWLEPSNTRIVWLTLIASMDETGFCQFAAVRNLANRAVVPLEETIEAVKTLEAPDPESGDPDHEGRRIERVPGGWMVLNAKKYRDIVTRANSQEKTRERVRRFREKKRGVTIGNDDVTPRNDSVTPSQAVAVAVSETPKQNPLPPLEISQIGKKTKTRPLPPSGGGKKVKRETKKQKTKASGMESTGVEVLASHGAGTPELLAVDGTGEDSSGGADNQETQEASRGDALDETTEDTRPDTADAKSRITQVLAMVPGISLGFAASHSGGGGEAGSDIGELPEEVDPPALTPQTIQGVSQRDRWQQLKLWLKQDLYMSGGAPINIQEVRFGTLSPGESDYDYCFRDSYLAEHEMTEEALVWIVGSESPQALTAGLKKYSTRIQGLLRQIVPAMRVQLKVQPAEYERRLG